MKRRLLHALTISIVCLLTIASVALAAWAEKFPIEISDTSAAARTNYPVLLGFGSDHLAGRINATGTDTNMQIGATSIKYMLSTDNVCAVIPSLPASGRAITDLYTGYSPAQTAFSIITGTGGSITTLDVAPLEMGSNFAWEISRYWDTTAAANKPYLTKANAFQIYNDPNVSGTITAAILSLSSVYTTYATGGDEAQPSNTTNFLAQTFTTTTAFMCTGASIQVYKSGTPDATATVSLRATSGGKPTGTNLASGTFNPTTLGGTPGAFVDITWATPVHLSASTMYALVLGHAGASGSVYWYDDGSAPAYANGTIDTSADSGVTWAAVDATKDFYFKIWSAAQVSATGVASGEKTVKVNGTANAPAWATGNILHFDGTGTSYVDAGAIYNGAANFWVSFWFKLDGSRSSSPVTEFLFAKRADATHYFMVYFNTTNSYITFAMNDGTNTFSLGTTGVTYSAGVWHHVIASTSAASGGRMIIDNSTTYTNPTAIALPAGGNMVIGNRASAYTNGVKGHVANVVAGTDALTPVEETALYNGIAPSDATDYWYIDGGTGTAITSYGSAANPGTAGAGTAWQTSTYTSGSTGRLCDYYIQVDSNRWGANLKGASVPDNANNIVFNNIIYDNYIKETVGGTQVLWYQPNALLSSTTLPDRSVADGVQNGTITWGSNSNVTITYGEPVSYASTSAGVGGSGAGASIGNALMPATWFAMGENVANLPFYNMVSAAVDGMDFPNHQTGEQTIYFIAIIGIAFAAFLGIVMFTRSALMAFAAMEIVFFVGSSMTIIPMWIPFAIGMVGLGIMFLYRQIAY